MRWWLNTDHKRFCVDNAVVSGLDFSGLPTDVWMVQWVDGKGEIERQFDKDTNDNGLRERFVDIIPYCGYFQDFLSLVKFLTLPQAKKVQIDLINEVYNSKRQAPFYYPIAAGNYWWDATDDTLFSSTIPAIQNATASLNAAMAALNPVVAQINSNTVAIINQNAGIGNTLVAQINSNIVNYNNAMIPTFDAMGNALIAYVNDTVLGTQAAGVINTVNYGLFLPGGSAPEAHPPGIPYDIPHYAVTWGNPYYSAAVGPGTFNNATAISYTPLPPVSVSNASWIPIGATAPVTVTPAEQAGIMNGIAARTNALNVKRNTKIGQVNALTTIAAVIAYDVTTGW
jgi:hypothetical protein